MKTAIVILNWNGADYLQKFLPVVIAKSHIEGVSIVVADNGSTDNSVEMLNNHFPTVKIIQLDKNYGFAGGYNEALRQTTADYYVLLNSDVEVTENWLEPLLAFMNKNEDVAACQPKICAFYEREKFEHAGAAGGFIDKYGFPFCRGRIFGDTEIDSGQYDTVSDIFWATGACLFIRAKDFWAAGAFDSDFFAHFEEIDLCWRLRSRGRRIVCVPQSIVYHIGGGTLKKDSPQKNYLNFRNNLLALYKNLPEKVLRKTLFARWFFDYLAAFKLVLSKEFSNAKMVFRARHDFCTMKKHFAEKRKINLAATTNAVIPEIFQKSLVFQYYLKEKKTFYLMNNE